MEETIGYLQNRFRDEQSRFDHFENKCAKFLTVVSIVIAAVSALAGLKDGVSALVPDLRTDFLLIRCSCHLHRLLMGPCLQRLADQ